MERASKPGLVAIGAVGLVLAWCVAPARAAGCVILLAAVVLAVPAFAWHETEPWKRNRLLGPTLLVLLSVSWAATVLSLAGLAIRGLDAANYAKRYGATVAVHPPNNCRYWKDSRGSVSDIDCPGSTWRTPDGTRRSGTLTLSWNENATKDGSVTAYAIGDRAYSTRISTFGAEYVFLGRLPLLPGLIGFPVAVICLGACFKLG